MKRGRIVALCGGVGGAKLAYGLSRVLTPEDLTIVVNTGDDFEHMGLAISPDIDTVIYTLAERANDAQGWGRADERWTVMQELERLGGDHWFRLGDRDIALHLLRTQFLRSGMDLTQTTLEIAKRLGVAHPILPMSNQPVRTIVHTDHGDLPFQHYFVRERCVPQAHGFSFDGSQAAQLSVEVSRALDDDGLRGVIVCPSNPYVSIAPMLAVPGMRERLCALRAPIVAISPIIGGRALKGPAAKMMAEAGSEVSALTVARLYADFIDAMILDAEDAALAAQAGSDDPQLICAATVMRTREERIALAQICLSLLDRLPP